MRSLKKTADNNDIYTSPKTSTSTISPSHQQSILSPSTPSITSGATNTIIIGNNNNNNRNPDISRSAGRIGEDSKHPSSSLSLGGVSRSSSPSLSLSRPEGIMRDRADRAEGGKNGWI